MGVRTCLSLGETKAVFNVTSTCFFFIVYISFVLFAISVRI